MMITLDDSPSPQITIVINRMFVPEPGPDGIPKISAMDQIHVASDSVNIPTSKMETAPGVRIPAPKMEIAPAPKVQMHVPTPKMETAPEVRISAPKTETAPEVQIPAPKTETAPKVQIHVPTPKMETAQKVRIPASKMNTAPEVRIPTLKKETAPEVRIPIPKMDTAPEVRIPTLKMETAPEVQIPKMETGQEVQIPAPKMETAPEVQIPITSDSVKIPTPKTETAPKVQRPRRSSNRLTNRLRSILNTDVGSNASSVKTESANGLDSASRQPSDLISNGKADPEDHAYSLRKKRRSTGADVTRTTCTVCGITVRPCDLQSHYEWEVDKLNKMLRPDGTRYRAQKADREKEKPSSSASSSSSKNKKRRNSTDDEDEEEEDNQLNPAERRKEFERIKNKRQERLYLRIRKNMRSHAFDDDTLSTPSTISATEGDDSMRCPICQIVLTGTPEERNSHAVACLTAKSSTPEDEDEDIDIEGDGFEEYTWAGQTRVRASTMLESGYKGLGFAVGQRNGDVDTELNIESDDDNAEFGPAQFSEADVIPCASDEMDEQVQALRNAVLAGTQERVPPLHPDEPSCSQNNNNLSTSNNPSPSKSDRRDDLAGPSTSGPSTSDAKNDSKCNPFTLYPGQSRTVLDSLRARIEELEETVNKQDSTRCLICMESYKKPTVSVQCWHVHCKECWLRTLGAKKLCPQCNMITSPSHLRQIYL